MNSFWIALLPVISLAVGVAGTLVAEALRDSRARRREEAATIDARKAERFERREKFELDALRTAYDGLNRLGRAATRYHVLDLAVAKSTDSPYASHRLDDLSAASGLDEELRVSTRDALAAARLIIEDALRDGCLEAVTAFTMLGTTPITVDRANAEYERAVAMADDVLESIADRIRFVHEREEADPLH